MMSSTDYISTDYIEDLYGYTTVAYIVGKTKNLTKVRIVPSARRWIRRLEDYDTTH